MSPIYKKPIFDFVMFLLVLAAIGLALYVADYRALSQRKLVELLAGKGIIVQEMTVEALSPMGFEATNVKVVAPWGADLERVRFETFSRKLTVWNLLLHEGFSGSPLTLNGEAVMSFADGGISIDGAVRGQPDDIAAKFRLASPARHPELGVFSVPEMSMRWGQGTVVIRDVNIPLKREADVPVNIQLSRVALSELVKRLDNGRSTATGTVSGVVPLVLKADGKVDLGTGSVVSDGPGVLKLAHGTLPAASEEMQMLSAMLSNFEFSHVGLYVQGKPGQPLAAQLKLEGSSPAAYGGQPVKLNVNLSGDVLQLIRSSMSLNESPHDLVTQH